MEVIYGNKKNNQEVKLPLNIKKYGKTDGRCKVYIEDYAYTFINGLKQDEYEGEAVIYAHDEVKALLYEMAEKLLQQVQLRNCVKIQIR